MPQYDTLMQGKDLPQIAGSGQGNRPSQEGGIFGGGSYEADSRNLLPPRGPPSSTGGAMPAVPIFRKPVNNESSIEGGIFGTGGGVEATPSQRSNRSNESSVPGGIFGTEGGLHARPASGRATGGRNSNASSIPGGIFG